MGEETLLGLFKNSLEIHGSRVAVIEDTGCSRCQMTYMDLWETSCIVSDALAQFCKNNGRKTQFIAVCIDQCLIYPAIILGILHQGFGYACIDPTWTSDKQTDYLKKLKIALLIHSSEERTCNSKQQLCRVPIRGTSLFFESFKQDGQQSNCLHPMAYAVLTSGSTGQPKTVRVPHASVVPNIISLLKICEVTWKDIIFMSSPSTFDPSTVDMFLAFASGAALLVTTNSVKTSAASLLHVLFPLGSSQRVSVLQMTPSVFNRWSEKELKEVVLGSNSSLRVLLLGGELFPSLTKLAQCRGTGNATKIYNIYGITEVSPWASIHQVMLSENNAEENSVPLGEPLTDTLLQVRDSVTGAVVVTGQGEMFIGSSQRICEIDYENCMEFTAPLYRATGDIIQVKSDGRFYYIGRKDLTVKRWGRRINLENVEQIALGHPSVKSACSVWDETSHKLYLIVAISETVSNAALRRHFIISAKSEKALVPDEIVQVNDISLTVHGKVNRHSIIDLLDKSDTPQLKLFVAKKFVKLWCDTLGLSSLQEGSFLHFGGNSLLAIILITELENNFGAVPNDFAGLLLSDKSFKFICERLCQFYQEKNKEQDLAMSLPSDIEAVSSPECTNKDKQELSNNSDNEQDSLISFSLLGKSSRQNTPSFDVPQSLLENSRMDLIWKVDLGKCLDASPLCLVYKSGKIGIVIGSHSGKFTFVDGITGKVRWLINLPHRIEASACPSSCGQYVYVGCHDGALYCISTFNGAIKWSFPTGGIIKCAPVLCNEGKSVMFGSYDSKVYCISSNSGLVEWNTTGNVKGNWLASPLVIKDIAILCSLSSKAHAVQTTDGQVIWTASFHHPIFSTPCHFSIPSGNYVVIAEVKGRLSCFELFSGKQVWTWQSPGLIYAPLTAVSSFSPHDTCQILVGCNDCFLYCLSVNIKNEMVLKWKVSVGASILSAPFAFTYKSSNGSDISYCIISNKDGKVDVVGLDNGKLYCKYNAQSEIFSSPVVFKDRAFFGCRDNSVYCVKIEILELSQSYISEVI